MSEGFPKINATDFTEKLLSTYFQNDHKHYDMIRNFILTLQEALDPDRFYTSEETEEGESSSSEEEWGDVDESEDGMEMNGLSNLPHTEVDQADTIAFTNTRRVDVIVLYQFVRNLFENTFFAAFVSFNQFHATLF